MKMVMRILFFLSSLILTGCVCVTGEANEVEMEIGCDIDDVNAEPAPLQRIVP